MSISADDRLFDAEQIERAIVPVWKYWLLPLIHPLRYRQVRWSFTTSDGKVHKYRGLLTNLTDKENKS